MNTLEQKLISIGIGASHLAACRMPKEAESVDLVDAGLDMFERPIQMTSTTFPAWLTMQQHALESSIELQVISAFRSIDYQCELISNKLRKGISLDEILKVNAIPGYSEHHSGRALDLSSPGFEPLEESFERSNAFGWLEENASRFGFRLSYPRNNVSGIDYEPWHWAFQD